MLNHHTSPGRSPFGSPHGASDLMARQRDAFGKSEEPVRGLYLDWAGATPPFAARCVTDSVGSLQPIIASLRDEFRPRTGEKRESEKRGFHKVPVKKVSIRCVHPSVPEVSPNVLFTCVFSTALKQRNRKAAVGKLQKWAGVTHRAAKSRPDPFGGDSRLSPLECAARVLEPEKS